MLGQLAVHRRATRPHHQRRPRPLPGSERRDRLQLLFETDPDWTAARKHQQKDSMTRTTCNTTWPELTDGVRGVRRDDGQLVYGGEPPRQQSSAKRQHDTYNIQH
jgi:hypothetical protein